MLGAGDGTVQKKQNKKWMLLWESTINQPANTEELFIKEATALVFTGNSNLPDINGEHHTADTQTGPGSF